MALILILGASRGLGRALAEAYLAQGHQVIATVRKAEDMVELQARGARVLQVDLADPASVSGLAWQLDGEKIDTAWHVAGVMCSRADATQPPTQQDFDRVMHANVLGAMQVIPQVAPLVEAAQGRFAFLSSVMGQIGSAAGSNAWLYRVSKAALNMAVASARHAYPQATFVCLHPGWAQTDMGGGAAPVAVPDSAAGLRRVVAALTPADNGAFLQYDGQRFSSW